MNSSSLSRRDFVKSSAVVASAAALGSLDLSRSAYAGGSDEIKIVLIGCGGRGAGAAANALGNSVHPNVKLIAMADAVPDAIERSHKALQAQFGGKIDVPEQRRFVGLDAYQQALAVESDIVLLCSPPGFHPVQFEAAVKAGRHIFMEKPVAVDAPGYRKIKAANENAKKKNLCVAVGHHLRHGKNHRAVIAQIHDGLIGEVQYIRAFYNMGPIWNRARQPGMNEMQYQIHNWYHFIWLGGDQVVEQHVHGIDVCNWIARAAPVEVVGTGGRQVRAEPGIGEIFDHHCLQFTYPDGTHCFSECRQQPGCWTHTEHHAHGTKGSVSFEFTDTVTIRLKESSPQRLKPGLEGHQAEWEDLMAAIVGRQTYNEVDLVADSTMTAILGRMASYSGQLITWEQGVKSELTYAPERIAWDAEPRSKPGRDGIYPCALPGVTKLI